MKICKKRNYFRTTSFPASIVAACVVIYSI